MVINFKLHQDDWLSLALSSWYDIRTDTILQQYINCLSAQLLIWTEWQVELLQGKEVGQQNWTKKKGEGEMN